jgi:Na+-driven multidrug efflux pump
MGVSGAALATFVSILIADILTVIYFEQKYLYRGSASRSGPRR